MKATIAAIIMAFTPTAAQAATVYIDLDRMSIIREAAEHICKAVIDVPGPAAPILNSRSSYLRLTQDERLYLVSLCILYSKGRNDQGGFN